MLRFWMIVVGLCFLSICINNVNANTNCIPTLFYIDDFPPKIARLEQYNISIQIRLPQNDFKSCDLKVKWSVDELSNKNLTHIISGSLRIKKNGTNVTLDGRSIPIDGIFKIQWWMFSVNLTIPHEKTREIRKPFQWALDYLKIVGGQKRTAFISDGDLVLDVNTDKSDRIFTNDEKTKLLRHYTWVCSPNLIFFKRNVVKSLWVVEQNNLTPARYHCYVNVTLFINKTVDVVHIGNQYAYQFISVENKPPTDFYIHCIENCDLPTAKDDTLLEIKCSDCQEENIVWEISEGQNISGKIQRRSKRIQIEGGTFKPGSNVSLEVSDGKKRFFRLVHFQMAKPPTLTITCKSNCDELADVTKETVFHVACTPKGGSQCNGIDWGRPNATGHKPYWYENSTVSTNKEDIKFKPYTFKEGEKPVITAFVGNTLAAFDNITFKVKQEISFQLTTNNNEDPQKETVINVICTFCVPPDRPKDRQFFWTIDPKIPLINPTFNVDKSKLTFQANAFRIPLSVYTMENPSYEIHVTITHEGKSEMATVKFTLKVPKLSWTCVPKLQSESNESPEGKSTTVFTVKNQCAYREANCTIKCLDNCQDLKGFKWSINSALSKGRYKTMTDKLTDDMLLINPNSFLPEEVFTLSAQLQGVIYPPIKLEIKWTFGIDNKYKLSEECTDLNPWTPHKFTVKCEGQNCASCLDPITIDYRAHEYNVTRNAVKNLLKVLDDMKTFLIPAYAFQDGEKVNIFVEGAHHKAKDPPHKCSFGFKKKPEFTITCISNCDKPCDPERPLQLHVACKPDTESLNCQDLEYSWWLTSPNRTYPLSKVSEEKGDDLVVPENILPSGVDISIDIDIRSFKAKTPYKFKCSYLVPKLQVTCFPLPCEKKPVLWPITMQLQIMVECIKDCVHVKTFTFESSNRTKTQDNETGINSFILKTSCSRQGDLCIKKDDQILITVSTGEKIKTAIKKTFKFFENIAEFKIKCIYNCDSNNISDPRLPVRLVADCTKNCIGVIYFWEIREKPNHPDYLKMSDFLILSSDNSSCTIKANTFKHRQNVKSNYVQVKLFADKKSAKIATRQIFFQEPKSEIVIECLENCNQSDPFKNVKLQVKCLRFCQVQEYTWELVKYPVGFDWNKHILLENDKRNFTILEKTFKNKDKVKVICYIGASKRKTTYDIYFKIPDPELLLKCIGMNCGELMNPHLEIEFEYECLKNCYEECKFKWKLEDSGGKDLTLNKYATVNANTNELTLKPYKFLNNTQLNVVLMGCGVTTKRPIQLSYPKPKINLKCKENCDHDPKRKTVYTVDCTDNCDGLVYVWDLTPPPKNKKWKSIINLKENILAIPPDMYEYDDKVTITAKVFEETLTKMVDFHAPYWEGKCDVIPGNGVAALTEFSVECKNFVNTATYYIFQEVEKNSADRLENPVTTKKRSSIFIAGNSETGEIFTTHVQTSKLGVLLNYTNTIPVTPLYLASCQKAIIVAIGQNWVIHVILRLSVDASAINNREYINSSSNIDRIHRSYDDEDKQVSIHQTINDRLFKGIQLLINEKRFHEAFQILAALDTDLCLKESGRRIRHYRKHFLRVLQHQLIEHLHPLQGISFYWKVLQCKCEQNDAFIGDFISKNLLATNLKLVDLLQKNRDYLPYHALTYYIDDCIAAIELLLSCSYRRHNSLFTRDIISPDYVLNERLIADEERELYYLHFMSNQIVQIVESILSLGLLAENETSYVLNSALVKFISFQSETVPLLIKIPNEDRSYISFHAFLESELKSKGSMFLFSFGIYTENIFWWDGRHFGNVSTLPIAHLLIQKDNQTVHKLISPIRVHFELNKEFDGVTIKKTIKSLKVFRILLTPQSLVVMTIESSSDTSINMTASVSDMLPSKETISQEHFINTTTMSLKYIARGNIMFLTLYSQNPVAVSITLKVFSCLSWDSATWAWQRNTCGPDYVENKLICKCYHLSLFTGTQEHVKLNDVEYLDTLMEMKIAGYHYYLVIACVCIFLLCLILFIMSYTYDRYIVEEENPVFISDNCPGDEHLYIIIVTTGTHWDAGTTAVVGIQLQGECGNSRRHLLNPPGLCRRVLQRNGVDCFLLYAPNDLGVIKRLRLWHNSRGHAPQWYCERIVVQYYRKAKTAYVFEPKRWLSLLALECGTSHCSIPLKTANCRPMRNMTWAGRLRQAWLDQTLDLCFFFCQRGTTYRCKERIATATATIYTAMVTAFFLVPNNDYTEFLHVLYTSLAASLVSLILFILFTKSLPRVLR